jgi:8-oxo-dGTP pyrophosphatase MutT (NUDIX family)
MMRHAVTAEQGWFSRFLPPDDGGRESAVLLLFGPDGDGAESLLLIERSHDMRSHPGQVALPGGATEPGDADAVATALREAAEEVRLDPSGVEVLGALPPLYLPPSGFVVTTVVGWWRDPSPVSVGDPAEVAQVIQAPLAYLTDPAVRHTVTHPSGYRGPAFVLGDDLLLWGFTAGVVTKALELAELDRSWDESRELPLPERFLPRDGGRR